MNNNTYNNRGRNIDISNNIDLFSYQNRVYTTYRSPRSYTTNKIDLFDLLNAKNFNDPEYILFFDHRGNDVWNDSSMTLQKGTKFEFFLISNEYIKPLVVGTCYSDPYEYFEKLTEKYEKWINQYLNKKNNGNR